MQLDKKTVEKMLALDDDQLRTFIKALAKRSGIDLSTLPISDSNLADIRRALAGADDETLRRAAEQFGQFKKP